MSDFYLKSGAGAVVLANQAWSTGNKMVPTRADATSNVAVAKKWVWECTTAGTTTGTPTWPASVTQDVTTVTQNGVVFTARKPGFSSGSTPDWTYSAIFFDYVYAALAAGDRLFQSNNHAESNAGIMVMAGAGTIGNPIKTISVNDGAAPPTAVTNAGTVTTTGANWQTIRGSGYHIGQTLISGNGFILNDNATAFQLYDTCSLQTTGGAIVIGQAGVANVGTRTKFKNCTFKLHSTGSTITFAGELIVEGGAFVSGTAQPVTMFTGPSDRTFGSIFCSGFDFSLGASTMNLISAGAVSNLLAMFRDCKLPASWAGSLVQGTPIVGQRIEMHNCDSGDTNYRLWVEDPYGAIRSETTLVRTGGSTDGDTAISLKFTPNANATFPVGVLRGIERVRRQSAIGSAITVTMSIIHDGAAALKDDEVWLEVMHLGNSGFPLGAFASDAKADVLATAANQAADTGSAWDSLITARANTTAYALGDKIKVATNTGRVFVCTTAGTSAGSEPGGYASAADGDAVTDNTATFRAMWRRKIDVTFTPQEKGYIHATPCVAKASPTLIYVDPKIVVT